MTRDMGRQLAVIVCVAALALQGCGPSGGDQPAQVAKAYLDKGDFGPAAAELKKALSSQPQSGDLRLMLGIALAGAGDHAAALQEYKKAADLKIPPDQVAPHRARSLLATGQDKLLVDVYATLAISDPQASAELAVSLAAAYLHLGQRSAAEKSLALALEQRPDNVRGRLLKATLIAGDGDIPGASRLVDQVVTSAPGDKEAWLTKGRLSLAAGAEDAVVLAAFDKALKIDPAFVQAHAAVILLQLKARRIAETEAAVQSLKKALPNNPLGIYFTGQIALLKGDIRLAKTQLENLLKLAPNDPRTLMLGGTVNFAAGSYIQAESYLAKLLAMAPADQQTRELLGRTYLKMGIADRSLSVLSPLLEPNSSSLEALKVAAEAAMMKGDFGIAESYYQRAVKLDPKDVTARTAMAMLDLSRGRADSAFSELQTVAEQDSSTVADMALVSAHARRNETAAALKAVDGLLKKRPADPSPFNLRARIHLAAGDRPKARADFERAVALDPQFVPAVNSLAALDVADGRPDAARQRLEAALKQSPKDASVYMSLATLLAATKGKPAEIEAMLRKAVAANGGDSTVRVALVDHLIAQHSYATALSEAQAAASTMPSVPEITNALGNAQFAAGESGQALRTFGKLASEMPNAAGPMLRMAEIQIARKEFSLAAVSLKRAIEIEPRLVQARRGLIALALRDKQYDVALGIARALQKTRPRDEVGALLEGDIEAKRQNWAPAIAAYKNGLKVQRTAELAAKIHTALWSSGNKDEAQKFSQQWLKDQPGDVAFAFYLGDFYLARQSFDAAQSAYRRVLAKSPEHVPALNNLAYVSMKLGQPGAIGFAEKADQLSPNKPDILDTLALALLADKQAAKALQVQQRAVSLKSEDPRLRVTLARIYLALNEGAKAKGELQQALAAKQTLTADMVREAKALMAGL